MTFKNIFGRKNLPQGDLRIKRLQFITTNHPFLAHSELAEIALQNGISQVRISIIDGAEEYVELESWKCKWAAEKRGGTIILDNHPEIAAKVGLHGVHVKTADHISYARRILGSDKIIGVSANTFDDIVNATIEGADYIMLEPYKTSDKNSTANGLGKQMLKSILKEVKDKNIKTPVLVSGGILRAEVPDILSTGVYGVGISGAIAHSSNIEKAARWFAEKV